MWKNKAWKGLELVCPTISKDTIDFRGCPSHTKKKNKNKKRAIWSISTMNYISMKMLPFGKNYSF